MSVNLETCIARSGTTSPLKRGCLTIFFSFSLATAATPSDFVEHRVMSGETLGQILYARTDRRLYGSKGLIELSIRLNPNLRASQGNKLFPGQIILLPFTNSQPHATPLASIGDYTPPAPELSSTEGTGVIKEKGQAFIGVRSRLFYSEIQSRDDISGDTANFLSGRNYSLELRWHEKVSEDGFTTLFFMPEHHEYEPTSQGYKGDDYRLLTFGAGYRHQIKDHILFDLAVSSGERLFPLAVNTNRVTLRRATVRDASASINYLFHRYARTLCFFELGYSYLFSSQTNDFSIKPGHGLKGSSRFEKEFKNFVVTGEFFYSRELQGTNVATRRVQNLGIGLSLGRRFFE